MSHSRESSSSESPHRETSGTEVLIWVFWGGILFAVIGESVLFALAGAGGQASGGLTLSHAAVSSGFALLALGGAFSVRVTSILGKGLPAALVCWMLLKSVAIIGLVAHQLGGSLVQIAPFFAAFAIGMAGWNPSRFEGPS